MTRINNDTLTQYVAEILKDLPNTHQLILSLYYIDNLDFPAISQVLSLPLPDVHALYAQAAGCLMHLKTAPWLTVD